MLRLSTESQSPVVVVENDATGAALWPKEVDLILSAMDAASAANSDQYADRRSAGRFSYRVRAELRLFTDNRGAPPWVLYTRDAHQRGLGFITPHCLPLGYGGKVQLISPAGRLIKAPCTLIRCRETAPGWYEGALNFNRDQWDFEFE